MLVFKQLSRLLLVSKQQVAQSAGLIHMLWRKVLAAAGECKDGHISRTYAGIQLKLLHEAASAHLAGHVAVEQDGQAADERLCNGAWACLGDDGVHSSHPLRVCNMLHVRGMCAATVKIQA
jgi:hypothetical protein